MTRLLPNADARHRNRYVRVFRLRPRCRLVTVAIALEREVWLELHRIADGEGITPTALIERIRRTGGKRPLDDSCRLYVIEHLIAQRDALQLRPVAAPYLQAAE